MPDSFLTEKQGNFRRLAAAIRDPGGSWTAKVKPVILHLEITTRCNLKCLKCGHATDPPGTPRIQPRHLQYSIVESFDEYFASSVRVHTFGYGEMFLYAKLQRLVERLKHFGCMVDGITNGMLVGEKELDWLVDLGYDELTFSIDGAEQETMHRLRGADLNKILMALAYLKRRKEETGRDRPRVVVNFVAQSDNIHELPALVRKLSDLNVFFLGVNSLMAPAADEDQPGKYATLYSKYALFLTPRAVVEDALEEARRIAANAGIGFAAYVDLDALYDAGPPTRLVQIIQPTDGGKESRPEKLEPYYCAYPWMSAYVHANGGSRVCCYMAGDLGTVENAEDFDRAWNTGMITEIRDAVSRGEVHASCALCVSRGRYQHSYIDLGGAGKLLGIDVPHPS